VAVLKYLTRYTAKIKSSEVAWAKSNMTWDNTRSYSKEVQIAQWLFAVRMIQQE
jgi:hypothetical protein